MRTVVASASTPSIVHNFVPVTPTEPTPADPTVPRLRPEEARFIQAGLGALTGHRRIVELMGEPGSGKTRLLADFTRLARERGWLVLRGSGTDSEPGVRCQLFVEALRGWLADRGNLERRDAATWLMRKLATGPFPSDSGRSSSVVDDRCHTFSAITGLFGDWSHTGLALVLDDVHAADAGSLELLEYLLRWPTDAPVALIVAHRPAQSPPRLRALLAQSVDNGTAASVELGPLTLAHSAQLTGLPAESPELRLLHHAARGIPLYLLALSRWRGTLPQDLEGDAWLTRGPALPPVFTARAEAELQPLTMQERAVAASAAVLGDTFDLAGVSVVASMREDVVCDALQRLYRLDIIRGASHGGYHFRHPLLRRVLYEETEPCWRLGAHRRALAVLVPRGANVQTLALHVERSRPGAAADDIGILAGAARESMRAGELAVAAERLGLTLRLMAGGGDATRQQGSAEARERVGRSAERAGTCRAERVAELVALAEELTARTGRRALRDQAVRLARGIGAAQPPGPERGARRRNAGPAAADRPLTGLTTREREVAEIAATGKRTRDIAEHLGLSPRTVDVHLSRIYRKLGVTSRAELARYVAESGIARRAGSGGGAAL